MAENDSSGKGFTVTDRRSAAQPDAPATPASAPSDDTSPPRPEARTAAALPAIDFSTFVMSLASSALIQLGELYDPSSPEGAAAMPADLPLAKQTIDIVGMLADKTRGNLSDDEARLMEHLLYDLRLKYVAAKKKQ